jgi:hypothetical protein
MCKPLTSAYEALESRLVAVVVGGRTKQGSAYSGTVEVSPGRAHFPCFLPRPCPCTLHSYIPDPTSTIPLPDSFNSSRPLYVRRAYLHNLLLEKKKLIPYMPNLLNFLFAFADCCSLSIRSLVLFWGFWGILHNTYSF